MANGGDVGAPREHAVTLVDRQRLSLTGVEDVDCFNEQLVVLRTPLGTLTIAGEGLNMTALNLERGCAEIEGSIEGMEYSADRRAGGLLRRLFR